ncbi:hypothetical protein [Formosa algae]|uniref:Uncharacterized protein n=1 Tax=Formosa algae TaxID=225843 RepID=A0A9X0YJH6_9FLAO|nr:hypothetical protein [Formosa algae]MBP1839739.1 hypothetical protein [Formosa algae]MDQ0335338.1 hypothetical protein [Formosa algae]OEI79267.1 hypothetical protein AST99_15720 [Formosa algae]PNW26748.1 hypothetical protein BKP44_15850 [Formosa algae]
MLSDKTSFILCVLVALGFSITGILDLLDNFVVVTLLLLGFLLVVVNLFTHDKIQVDEYEKPETTEEDFEMY